MNRRRIVNAALAAVLAAGCGSTAAWGQQSRPAAATVATIPYADYTFGFTMQIPAGWAYDRTRFAGPGGAVGLLRGTLARDATVRRATLQIMIFRNIPEPSFADWVTAFEKNLAAIAGVKHIKDTRGELETRQTAIVEVEAQVGGDSTRTLYYCVSFDAVTIWVCAFAAFARSDAEEQAVRAHFEQMIGTLRVLYDAESAKRFAEGIERGKTLIARLRGAAERVPLDASERYYEMLIAGRPVGYLARRARRDNQSLDDARYGKRGKPGIRVTENSWRFADDGMVRHGLSDAYCSLDLVSEKIETRNTHVRPSGAAGGELFITLDECVRERELLFSSYSTNLDGKTLPAPRAPLRIGDDYLPVAWVRVLPKVLGTRAGKLRAFATYDPATRGLISHAIKPLGPRPLPGKPDVVAYAFETWEGFSTDHGVAYTDVRGNLLRYEAGDLVLRSVAKAVIERKYGARRAAAEKRRRGK